MDDLHITEVIEHGQPGRAGNLLGIQPYMRVKDYASEEACCERLEGYFRAAAQRGWINGRTVAVLPEYLGTWLVACGENQSVLAAQTLDAAMRALILRRPLAFTRELARTKEKDRAAAALFRVKAERMAAAYQAVFSRLAGSYQITVVAGSIVLPAPRVVEGRVTAGKGELYNTTAVFGPDGRAEGALVRKAFLTESEKSFLSSARVDDLPVFDTPAGRLGVLICADSWYPEPYHRLREQDVELLAVPSALFPGSIWTRPWMGYNGAAAPADVDGQDAGRLTEKEAWARYALLGRKELTEARAGINVFLHGELWDMDFIGGAWFAFHEDYRDSGELWEGSLLNIWL